MIASATATDFVDEGADVLVAWTALEKTRQVAPHPLFPPILSPLLIGVFHETMWFLGSMTGSAVVGFSYHFSLS